MARNTILGYTSAMIDEAPVPTDALGSLFDFASWLYPRVWTGFLLSWAVVALPVGLLSLAVAHFIPGGVAGALRDGAWSRAAVAAGMQAFYWSAIMCHGWLNIVLVDAGSREGEVSFGDALTRTVSRLPAQIWTLAHTGFRIMPLALVGGVVAGLTLRDSPLTAAGAVLLIAIPVIYFTIRWSLSSFVTLIEGISGGAALRRSSELCGGRFWLYAFHFALFQALVIVPSVVMSVGGVKVLPLWAATLFAPAASAIILAPFSGGLFLGLYRREEKRVAVPPEGAVPA